MELQRRRGAHPDSVPGPWRPVWVSLENCTYSNRPAAMYGSLSDWLDLLRHHTCGYQPRAYQQLAAVHRATGHERDAGRILMAQQDHRRASALRPDPVRSARWWEGRWRLLGLWVSRAGLAVWKAALGTGTDLCAPSRG